MIKKITKDQFRSDICCSVFYERKLLSGRMRMLERNSPGNFLICSGSVLIDLIKARFGATKFPLRFLSFRSELKPPSFQNLLKYYKMFPCCWVLSLFEIDIGREQLFPLNRRVRTFLCDQFMKISFQKDFPFFSLGSFHESIQNDRKISIIQSFIYL